MIQAVTISVKGEELKRLCEEKAQHFAREAGKLRGEEYTFSRSNKHEDGYKWLEASKFFKEADAQCNDWWYTARHIDIKQVYTLSLDDARAVGIP